MTEKLPFTYRAFLSYAHADVTWARWLQRRLERFRIDKNLVGRRTRMGPVPRTLRPIFRDQEDFSGGQALTDATIAALDQSAALIVICSTLSARRFAVNEEVRLFRSRHPERPVIPVIVEGTFPDNFPSALRLEVARDGTIMPHPATILGPDLRRTGDGKALGLAKIVAGLIGVRADEIVDRAKRERRRRQHRWIAGISFIAVALTGLTVTVIKSERIRIEAQQKTIADMAADATRLAQAATNEAAEADKGLRRAEQQVLRAVLAQAEYEKARMAEQPKLRAAQVQGEHNKARAANLVAQAAGRDARKAADEAMQVAARALTASGDKLRRAEQEVRDFLERARVAADNAKVARESVAAAVERAAEMAEAAEVALRGQQAANHASKRAADEAKSASGERDAASKHADAARSASDRAVENATEAKAYIKAPKPEGYAQAAEPHRQELELRLKEAEQAADAAEFEAVRAQIAAAGAHEAAKEAAAAAAVSAKEHAEDQERIARKQKGDAEQAAGRAQQHAQQARHAALRADAASTKLILLRNRQRDYGSKGL